LDAWLVTGVIASTGVSVHTTARARRPGTAAVAEALDDHGPVQLEEHAGHLAHGDLKGIVGFS
jgi:hypothetical protein